VRTNLNKIIQLTKCEIDYLDGGEMKADIPPDFYDTTVTCACGNVIELGSTKKDIRVEICSKCHPFFTGKQKLVDSAGRIERFRRKYAKFQKESQ